MSNEEKFEESKKEAPSTSKPKARNFQQKLLPAASTRRRIIIFFVVLLLLLGSAALVLYIIYRPSKPAFSISAVTIYQLDITVAASPTSSSAAAIVTTMEFLVVARNAAGRSSAAFDRIVAYAAYGSQPITPPARLPPFVLEQGDSTGLGVMVGSDTVAVAVLPEIARGFEVEKAIGAVRLSLVVKGMLKYKVGPFSSRWDRVTVLCDVLVDVRGFTGSGGQQTPLVRPASCSVDT